ncbi:GATA zinc finger domain-containing protein 1 [Ctenocephalides felis]|uniref:GATA zinc finger domain-containing protein 1 n=1 Tax=Ctenocephalides felis TaxID=7515 RepID=UPI000E6E4989|nr:GATA zinc finger domain-containing protein 1 [Ctenocephalides felis]
MPFGIKSICVQCDKSESIFWHNIECGKLCNECHENGNNIKTESSAEDNGGGGNSNGNGDGQSKAGTDSESRSARKTTRAARYKNRLNNIALKQSTKGKGRRFILKGKPMKAPSSVATVVTSDFLYYKGSYYQVGDIVSLRDIDGDYYYAQIRGLMMDQYCEKSAVITWLLPTQASPPPEEGFDPATYILGPEEDLPRKLSCMEFIVHAPSDYYKANTPYPGVDNGKADHYRNKEFIWTSLGRYERTKTSSGDIIDVDDE